MEFEPSRRVLALIAVPLAAISLSACSPTDPIEGEVHNQGQRDSDTVQNMVQDLQGR